MCACQHFFSLYSCKPWWNMSLLYFEAVFQLLVNFPRTVSLHIKHKNLFLPALLCHQMWSRTSPEGSGDDQTHSPVVAWRRRSDPVSSVSSGSLRCPESPRCADNSPDHLRRAEEGDRKKKMCGLLKVFNPTFEPFENFQVKYIKHRWFLSQKF